jgi:uncharacterized protein (TIGR02600 family)
VLRRATGAALLLTLGMLVLLSGLVLAFMLTVRTEFGAAKAYEAGTDARLLADSALNLVIGQLREASTQPEVAWISQPGLIRTFDTRGNAVKSYKLYSSDSMVVDGSFDPVADAKTGKGDLPPVLPTSDARSWTKQPGLWTNLNAPVADVTRTDPFDTSKKNPLMVYPIFDGNHIQLVSDPAGGGQVGVMSLYKDGQADIEGFKVQDFANRGVTMPVKWLYLLKDGTLAPAQRSGTAGDIEVMVPSGKEKTAQGEMNVPVARVAFWTDDETAKLNLNTASEGTFWDTPVGNSQPGVVLPAVNYQSSNDATFEWDLAERKPAQREYQRYPGHPATTCLSTIFGRQLLRRVGGDRARMIEEINKFIPRVTGAQYSIADNLYTSPLYDYSSMGGTGRAGPKTGPGAIGQQSTDETTYGVSPDADRLYATIDEFLYSPKFVSARSPWLLAPPVSSSTGRDPTREMLDMSRFFLTVNSKAPEQNLSNQPRISIWPIMLNANRRTAFDKLISFCSTVGPKSGTGHMPFHFTRENANSPTADLSANNLWLMGYLKGLTDRALPGGGTTRTFKDKYGADRDQILTEIFDYIRCTNLVDRSAVDQGVNSSYTNSVEGPLGTVPPDGDSYTGLFPPSFDSTTPMGPRGQVVPIEMPDGTRGIGRIVTISELALRIVNASGGMEFSFIPMEFCPMAGFSALTLGLRITFTKIDFKVTDSANKVWYPFNNDPSKAGSGMAPQPTLYDIGRMTQIEDNEIKIGGPMGFHGLCQETNGGRWPRNQGSPPDSVPPTGVAPVSPDGNMTVEGTVTVQISATAKPTPTNTTGEPVVQVITFKFPPQSVPRPSGGSLIGQGVTGSTSRGPAIARSGHVNISSGATIRSLVPVGNNLQGDMRLVAARRTVDETYFKPGPNGAYTDSGRENDRTHSLRAGWPGNIAGSAFGFLVPSITNFRADAQPCLPDGINGVLNSLGQPGDWDNGPAFVTDGPYCNKPDEGTKRHLHGAGTRENYTEGTLWGHDFSAPYIGWFWNQQDAMQSQSTFFSPNRQIPSPVMFGSLPTGVLRNKPWQTLLFRPAKSYLPGGTSHPGSAAGGMPPDHLLLDLFWMPVVEPYAISEPFATSGKINLNQQIAPFTNIRRDTGLRAVLKSVKMTAMNPNQQDNRGGVYSQLYKLCGTPGAGGDAGGGQGVVVRRNIDLDNTLKQITDRMDKNKPFISTSEICDIPLIPKDLPTDSNGVSIPAHVSAGFSPTTSLSQFDSLLSSFWSQHLLTGDNSLERPYTHIYPRLTTRSNTYTVHVRVQTLPQSTRNNTFILKAAQNQPTGEFRGSFVIERYLDANSAGFVDSTGKAVPNPGADTTGLALGPYRFRVVSSRQFTP